MLPEPLTERLRLAGTGNAFLPMEIASHDPITKGENWIVWTRCRMENHDVIRDTDAATRADWIGLRVYHGKGVDLSVFFRCRWRRPPHGLPFGPERRRGSLGADDQRRTLNTEISLEDRLPAGAVQPR